MTGTFVELTDTERSNLEKAVRFRIIATAAYPDLLKAALRFEISLYGKRSERVATREREYMAEPEDLLKVHSYVVNAKSARARTLRELSLQVIEQAGLKPYMQPIGKFRGDDSRIDWYKLPEQWRKG